MTAFERIATIPLVRKGRPRKTAGVLALAGLVLPGSAALIASVHLASHHEADHNHGGARSSAFDLSMAWHGHAHAEATPDHDHPLLLAATPPSVWPAAPRSFSQEPADWQYPGSAAVAGRARGALDPPGLTGSGPPGGPGRLTVLRI